MSLTPATVNEVEETVFQSNVQCAADDDDDGDDDDTTSVEAHYGDASCSSSVADVEECDMEDGHVEGRGSGSSSDEFVKHVASSSQLPTVAMSVSCSANLPMATEPMATEPKPIELCDSEPSARAVCATALCQSDIIIHDTDTPTNNTKQKSLRRESAERTAVWCEAADVIDCITDIGHTASASTDRVSWCDDSMGLASVGTSTVGVGIGGDACGSRLADTSINVTEVPSNSSEVGDSAVLQVTASESSHVLTCAVNLPSVEDGLSSGHVSDADDVDEPAHLCSCALEPSSEHSQQLSESASVAQLMSEIRSAIQHTSLVDSSTCHDIIDDDDSAQMCCHGNQQQPLWITRFVTSDIPVLKIVLVLVSIKFEISHFSISFYTVSELFSVLVSIVFFRNYFSSVLVSVFTSFQ